MSYSFGNRSVAEAVIPQSVMTIDMTNVFNGILFIILI